MPEVSVVIPTYNRAELLKRAIRTVLNQTYQDFELIVVDDGSTDNTEQVVRGFDDGRITYVRHEKNMGVAAARNTGIRVGKGQYIAFQDSDDEWMPGKLEKQMSAFENAPPGVGVVYTGFWRIEGDKKTYIPSSKINPKDGNIHDVLLKGNFIGTPAALVKRECFGKVEMFDEELPMLEDWELWIRISKYYQFKCIDEPQVISYYIRSGVNEQSNRIQVQALKSILERHFEDIKKDRKLLASDYVRISELLFSNEEARQGRNYLIKALMAYPLNIKLLLFALISLFGQGAHDKALKVYRKTMSQCSKEK